MARHKVDPLLLLTRHDEQHAGQVLLREGRDREHDSLPGVPSLEDDGRKLGHPVELGLRRVGLRVHEFVGERAPGTPLELEHQVIGQLPVGRLVWAVRHEEGGGVDLLVQVVQHLRRLQRQRELLGCGEVRPGHVVVADEVGKDDDANEGGRHEDGIDGESSPLPRQRLTNVHRREGRGQHQDDSAGDP